MVLVGKERCKIIVWSLFSSKTKQKETKIENTKNNSSDQQALKELL